MTIILCSCNPIDIAAAMPLNFGFAHGDSAVPIADDGSTGEIKLETDVDIFGFHQDRLYVSSL